MIILATAQVIAITVSAGTATIEAAFADRNGAAFTEGAQRTSLTATSGTVVAAPSAGVRLVKNLYVRSGSAATITVTVAGQVLRTIDLAASQTIDMLAESSLVGAALDSAVVHLAGTETITGAKTFTSGLTVSSGTTALQATTCTTLTASGQAASAGLRSSLGTNTYWSGSAFVNDTVTTFTTASSFTKAGNSTPGCYDSGFALFGAQSDGTMTLVGSFGQVGMGTYTAGNLASQISDLYITSRDTTGAQVQRMRFGSSGSVATFGLTSITSSAAMTAPAATAVHITDGKVRCGNTSATSIETAGGGKFGSYVQVTISDAGTTNAATSFILAHESSGTPSAGFGTQFLMDAESTTTAGRSQALFAATWVDATDASRKARLALNVYDTAAREGMRLEASGSAPMVGFLGASAVVRQTLGAAATDAATTQTLANNIRTALINLGLCQN